MSKQDEKEIARAKRKHGDDIYAIDLLISTWRHLSKLHDMGLSENDGAQYLDKAREMFQILARADTSFLKSSAWLRLSPTFHGS
ncbi:MAG: hypothetical protein IJR28_00090 [Ottowia sp.]|nr:hypothetical protein [Ottowia sp.]